MGSNVGQPYAIKQHTDWDQPTAQVRKTLAGLFHEVARVVGKDCAQLLTRPLCRLLRDEAPAVQAVLLPSLTATLAHWSIRDEARRDAAMGELAKALLELESGAKRNWRLQQQLAAAFPMFPQVRVHGVARRKIWGRRGNRARDVWGVLCAEVHPAVGTQHQGTLERLIS